ncbi:hypothetical protein [Desulfofundulus thermosubterraneus]|uniref:Uncharacterized protein n=1 Tax=Desulfofundulus thermosubterraneus DSM 16057 TaxID=1121432 RepID=A0A1M6GXW2_9FIRM|nr:hypothetical protein [Desulfofundulus thermosubterraneus]SHJ14772.1 hypothetical protein SAMN02745219_01843 [Desulfofundulus thermosubterraneus DSM 16057]
MNTDDDRQILESNSHEESKTIDELTKEESFRYNGKGQNRKAVLIIFSLLICTLVAWQGISSVMFTQKVKVLWSESNKIQDKLDKLNNIHNITLVQAVKQIKDIKKENEELIDNYQVLSYRYRFTLSLLKNNSLLDKLETRNKELDALLRDCERLMSLVQRSEQIDKDMAAFSGSMIWRSVFNKMDTILAENTKIKSELVELVVPEQLEFYHKTFIEALNEKELYLIALNDFLYSAFNANIKAEMAISTYENAYFYWEIDQAVSYANEAEEFRNQADHQLAEAVVHWKRYMELKEKIKETETNVEEVNAGADVI